jgi:hypothetical protein
MDRPPSPDRRTPAAATAVLIALLAVLALAPADANAWSNGTNGPNSFGTHDWIVRQAVRMAGRQARWVCVKRAMRATDDPDILNGIDHASGTWWHVYDRWGSIYGGAPEAVAVWFRRTKAQLRAGDRCAASRALGIMAHLLGDVAQPMHTDGWLDAEDSVHSSYEQAVDARCTASRCRYRARNNGPDPASPSVRTRTLARRAHPYYADLIRDYRRHGYNRAVDKITRRQLGRAANTLADLIRRT